MKKQFFAEEGKPGLTSAKAQRLCTWASKAMMRAEAKVARINFVTEETETCSTIERRIVTEVGDTQYSFDAEIKEMVELTSLMSWLHEAINYKDALNKNIQDVDLDDYCSMHGIETPRLPIQETHPDAMEQWEPEKVARYYHLQNVCSILQKLVGQRAPYEKAIKRLLEVAKVPREKEWHGDTLYVKVYIPSVDSEKAITTFNKYQRMHDEAQSELNGMRYELEQANEAARVAARDKYVAELDEYRTRLAKLRVEFTNWKDQESEAVRKLKIRIPDNLLSIFNKVRSLGKDTIELDNE